MADWTDRVDKFPARETRESNFDIHIDFVGRKVSLSLYGIRTVTRTYEQRERERERERERGGWGGSEG